MTSFSKPTSKFNKIYVNNLHILGATNNKPLILQNSKVIPSSELTIDDLTISSLTANSTLKTDANKKIISANLNFTFVENVGASNIPTANNHYLLFNGSYGGGFPVANVAPFDLEVTDIVFTLNSVVAFTGSIVYRIYINGTQQDEVSLDDTDFTAFLLPAGTTAISGPSSTNASVYNLGTAVSFSSGDSIHTTININGTNLPGTVDVSNFIYYQKPS